MDTAVVAELAEALDVISRIRKDSRWKVDLSATAGGWGWEWQGQTSRRMSLATGLLNLHPHSLVWMFIFWHLQNHIFRR